MAQVSVPTSFTGAGWSGVYTALGDSSETTYVESPGAPTAAETFVCDLAPMSQPVIHTDHQLRLNLYLYPPTGDPLKLVLALENVDDDSVVATFTHSAPATATEYLFPITEAEAISIHDYSSLRIRGYAEPAATTYFVWSAVVGATSYVLQVRRALSVTYDMYDADVDNVLTFGVGLAAGTYYARVVPVGAGSATAEQTVVVT